MRVADDVLLPRLRPVLAVVEDVAFLVHPDANKSQIKEAVEKMFEGAKVAKVNTVNSDGKTKRRGMTFGKTSKSKKAYVQLTADSADIELFEGL